MKKIVKIIFIFSLINIQLFSIENIDMNETINTQNINEKSEYIKCLENGTKAAKYLDQKTANYINEARCKDLIVDSTNINDIENNNLSVEKNSNSSDVNVSIETNVVIDNNTSISIKGSLIVE